MPARIATQTFQEAGGKAAYPHLEVIGVIRKEYVISYQTFWEEDAGDGISYTCNIESLKEQGIYCETIEEAFKKFAATAEEMGYIHVFGVKVYEDDRRTILMGDGYGTAGTT